MMNNKGKDTNWTKNDLKPATRTCPRHQLNNMKHRRNCMAQQGYRIGNMRRCIFFSIPRTFRAIAFAYFGFRVRRVEFVSWSRSCCWLGHVRVQFMCFPHRFHQILVAMTNFARIVPVLSSNSESVLKTGLVFAYELGFRRSIYQN